MIPREKLQRVTDHLLAAQAELSVPSLRHHPLALSVGMSLDLVNMEPQVDDPRPEDGEPTVPLLFPWDSE